MVRPVTHVGTVLPGPKEWRRYDEELTSRGELPPELLGSDPTSWRLETGRRGRPPLSHEVLVLAQLLRVTYRMALRAVVGLLRSWCRFLGEDEGLAPRRQALSRRLHEVSWLVGDVPDLSTLLPGPRVVAIDGTGFSLRGVGRWFAEKHHEKGRHAFEKLHACVDVETGVVLAWVVTRGDGPGSGDVSVGPELIRRAASVVQVGAVLADRAYDAKSCWSAAREAGAVLVCEPKEKAAYGLDPDRDQALAQIGKIGPPRWKVETGYHGRSLVESAFGALKQCFGDRLRSRTVANREAELSAMVGIRNGWLLDALRARKAD